MRCRYRQRDILFSKRDPFSITATDGTTTRARYMEIGSLPPVTIPAFNPLSQSSESETGETPVLLGARAEEETAQDRLDSTNVAHRLPLLASGAIAANETAVTSSGISVPGASQTSAGNSFFADELDAALTASVIAETAYSTGQDAAVVVPHAVEVAAPAPSPTGKASDGGAPEPSQAAAEADGRGTGGPGTEELTEEEQQKVQELKSRDREVRQHEQAHMAAAGGYARGGPSYEYTTGPDNRRYATGGEVSIDTSRVADDPEATIRKAQVIYRAAIAPAEPSSQDRSVASEAKQMEAEARREMAESRRSEATEEEEPPPGSSSVDGTGEAAEAGGEDGVVTPDGAVIPEASSEQVSGSHSAGQASSFDGATATAGDAGQLLNLVA